MNDEIIRIRNQRTKTANCYVDELCKEHESFSPPKSMIAYMLSEYDVSNNLTNPNYLHEQRNEIIPVLRDIEQFMKIMIDQRESDRVGRVVIDLKEFEKQKDVVQQYLKYLADHFLAYTIVTFYIPSTSTLHTHARDFTLFDHALTYVVNHGTNYTE